MSAAPGATARTSPRHPGGRGHQAVSVALAVSGWAVIAVTVAAGHSPVRVLAVFAFVLIAPGAAIARLLPVRDFLARAVLAVALSMSLAALAATAASLGRPLRPTLVLGVLAAVCSVAALTDLILARR